MNSIYNAICVEFYNIMSKFSDGTGNPDENAVRFLLATWFFSFIIIVISKVLINNGFNGTYTFLLVGATFGLIRNGMMFMIQYGWYRGFFTNEILYESFPLLDHTFQFLTLLSINLAILYISKLRCNITKYYAWAYIIPFALFGIFQFQWKAISDILSLTENTFDLFYGDVIYHYLFLVMMLSTLAVMCYHKKYIRLSLVGFVLFNAMDQVYNLINIHSHGILKNACEPLSHSYYLWAIPFLLYYVQRVPINKISCPLKLETSIKFIDDLGNHICQKN